MIATESGHWYTLKGEPCYTVQSAKGEPRATTLRDARKLNLVPSVTTITRTLAKPGLDNWKAKQLLMAALTLPRRAGETEDAFATRILEDAAAEAKAAAERGTELHGDIEKALQGAPHGSMEGVLVAVEACLSAGINLHDGRAEHSFAHPLGYGGKVDAHAEGWIVDFKTKEKIGDKQAKDLAYPEHAMQLAAYAHGLGLVAPRCLNVFVGVEDCKVIVHEWDSVAIGRGWEVFVRLLEIWQLQTGYKPTNQEEL